MLLPHRNWSAVAGKLIAIGAQFQLLLRTMLPQVLRDDAILQHPPERDAVTAGCPRQLSRQREIRRQQHRRAGDEGRGCPASVRQRKSVRAETDARSSRRNTVRAAPPAWRCARPRRKPSMRTAGIFPVSRSCRHSATRMKSASTDSPAKMSVRSVLASHGSAVVMLSTRPMRQQPQRLADAEHAQRQLQDPQRCQRLDSEIDPETRILAEMEIEAERRGAAGHE